jgi:transposase InsO family protein
VHIDVCGPMRKTSLNGALYFVAFRDDYTGYRIVNFMKQKSEVFEHFKNYSVRLENETGHRIITLPSDNGGEYTSNELEALIKEKGIRHETSQESMSRMEYQSVQIVPSLNLLGVCYSHLHSESSYGLKPLHAPFTY